MSYVDEVLARVKTKNAAEPEFHQAAEEVLESLQPGGRSRMRKSFTSKDALLRAYDRAGQTD